MADLYSATFDTIANPQAVTILTSGSDGVKPVRLEFTLRGNPKIVKGPLNVYFGIEPYLNFPTGDDVNTYYGVKINGVSSLSSSYFTSGSSGGMGGQPISCRTASTDVNNLVIEFPDWWGISFPEGSNFGIQAANDDGSELQVITTTVWFME